MMSRSQISLPPDLRRKAQRRAADLGMSFAEYLRRLVDRDLTRPRARVSPEKVFALGSSGGADVAREKDAMVAASLRPARTGGRRR